MLDEEIVKKLLLKYEGSKAYEDGENSRRKVELKISDKFFEGLRNGSADLDLALEKLSRHKFCEIHFRDDYLERIVLRVDDGSIQSAYAYSGRSNPKERVIKLVSFFRQIAESDYPVLVNFASYCLRQLESGKPNAVENVYGSLGDLEKIILCLKAMLSLERDVPERVFSAQVLGDTKAFALYRAKIEKVLRDFSDMSFDDDVDPIAFFGVVQNKTYAFVKGVGEFKIGGQVIDLNKYGHELALSDEMIESMTISSMPAKNLFTIENLTSFNEFCVQNSIVVYLGGFHNPVRRKLIEKIYKSSPGIECWHYGDIDAGGFYILDHLREKTGLPFLPYHMDETTLRDNVARTKPLTGSDERRLKAMLADRKFEEFYPVIEFMLKVGKKLEQESELILSIKN